MKLPETSPFGEVATTLVKRAREAIDERVPQEARSTLSKLVDAVEARAPRETLRQLLTDALHDTDPFLAGRFQLPLCTVVLADEDAIALLSIVYLGRNRCMALIRRFEPEQKRGHPYTRTNYHHTDTRIEPLSLEDTTDLLSQLPLFRLIQVIHRIITFYHILHRLQREEAQ